MHLYGQTKMMIAGSECEYFNRTVSKLRERITSLKAELKEKKNHHGLQHCRHISGITH